MRKAVRVDRGVLLNGEVVEEVVALSDWLLLLLVVQAHCPYIEVLDQTVGDLEVMVEFG